MIPSTLQDVNLRMFRLLAALLQENRCLHQENIENYFPIPVELLPNNTTFLLTVKGESMINAGILDGRYDSC